MSKKLTAKQEEKHIIPGGVVWYLYEGDTKMAITNEDFAKRMVAQAEYIQELESKVRFLDGVILGYQNSDNERILELEAALTELLEMHENTMKKVDWGKSFFNAEIIRGLNDVPVRVRALLQKVQP